MGMVHVGYIDIKYIYIPATQIISLAFIQRWRNVFDVGPAMYKSFLFTGVIYTDIIITVIPKLILE